MAAIGDEIELQVSVSGYPEGAAVTFDIFDESTDIPEGSDELFESFNPTTDIHGNYIYSEEDVEYDFHFEPGKQPGRAHAGYA